MDKCNEFCFQHTINVASSATIENDFKQLKTQILKFEVKPMKADKFVISHLKSIESNAKLFKSTELRNKSQQVQLQEIDELINSPKSIYTTDLVQTSEPEVIQAPEITFISDFSYTLDIGTSHSNIISDTRFASYTRFN